MKQKFWKNLFQGLSTFGAVMVFEIIGVLRRMPQNFLFNGLPDGIKDDYKLMDS